MRTRRREKAETGSSLEKHAALDDFTKPQIVAHQHRPAVATSKILTETTPACRPNRHFITQSWHRMASRYATISRRSPKPTRYQITDLCVPDREVSRIPSAI